MCVKMIGNCIRRSSLTAVEFARSQMAEHCIMLAEISQKTKRRRRMRQETWTPYPGEVFLYAAGDAYLRIKQRCSVHLAPDLSMLRV
jgi:hypothetical protein